MKTNLIRVAVAAIALTSFASFADDWNDAVPCDTDEATRVRAPEPRTNGHYEWVDTNKWIPPHYEQVTVQQCRPRHHGGWNRFNQHCYPVTESRLVPGHYQTVQEWVWVPMFPQHQQYSQYPGHRPPMNGSGR